MIAYEVMGLDMALRDTGVAIPAGTFRIRTDAKHQRPARLEVIRSGVGSTVAQLDHPMVFGEKMFATANNSAVLMSVEGVIRTELYRRGVPYVEVSTTKLKQFATGMGKVPGRTSNQRKQFIAQAVAEQTGHRFPSFDECDAFILRCMGLEFLGRPHPFGVVSGDQRRAVEGLTIEWSTLTGEPEGAVELAGDRG